jgi:hypothetical protein
MSEIVAVFAILIAAYSAFLARRTDRREKQREERLNHSQIQVVCGERNGLAGPPIYGTAVPTEHILIVRVINSGDLPEYVHEVRLQSQVPSPFAISVREAEGTVEVRPRDQVTFELVLDDPDDFQWDAPFRALVRLANQQTFYSDYAALDAPPSHGEIVVIPDPDVEPVPEIRITPGSSDIEIIEPGDDDYLGG